MMFRLNLFVVATAVFFGLSGAVLICSGSKKGNSNRKLTAKITGRRTHPRKEKQIGNGTLPFVLSASARSPSPKSLPFGSSDMDWTNNGALKVPSCKAFLHIRSYRISPGPRAMKSRASEEQKQVVPRRKRNKKQHKTHCKSKTNEEKEAIQKVETYFGSRLKCIAISLPRVQPDTDAPSKKPFKVRKPHYDNRKKLPVIKDSQK